jgi:hypothetical protein
MKLSEKTKAKLYEAIAEPVMQMRIKRQKRNYTSEETDYMLSNLVGTMWDEVQTVLKCR